jgi:hypothetical protein
MAVTGNRIPDLEMWSEYKIKRLAEESRMD